MPPTTTLPWAQSSYAATPHINIGTALLYMYGVISATIPALLPYDSGGGDAHSKSNAHPGNTSTALAPLDGQPQQP